MSKKILAKSNGITLPTHSKLVSEIAIDLYNKLCFHDDDIKQTIEISSLLHDIGKATTIFQDKLNNVKSKKESKYRHNEVGWAFVSKYLSSSFKNKEIIQNVIHWHHGISNGLEETSDSNILDNLDNESIDMMLDYLISIVGINNTNNKSDVIEMSSVRSSLFYPNNIDNLPKLMLIRSIVITADRLASDYSSMSEIVDNGVLEKYFKVSSTITPDYSYFNNSDRFNNQLDIISKCKKTTIIKAPAGFGKTLLGVLWGLENNKKTIWVTPRNTIAESLYLSIKSECEKLKINPNIQLIISGEIKQSTNDNVDMYDADIIITNIDNFLAPSFKNNIMDASALLLGANVVFDEYHELVTDAPYMSLFINVMRIRNIFTESNTLLLSATPIPVEFLWRGINKETLILPNLDTHYKAVHAKKYKLNVSDKACSNVSVDSNSLVIKNTIKSAQNTMSKKYGLLLHSDFIDSKKESDFKELLDKYGKSSEVSDKKKNVLGTHIIQASLDITFNNIYEDVLSPQSTLQRIGRCDRFGNNVGDNSINITQINDNLIKNILYDNELSDSWYTYIKKYNNTYITLDELYVLYNSFQKEYNNKLITFVKNKESNSKVHISKIYPIKYVGSDNNDIRVAGSNKLRSVNSEIFYIIRHKKNKDEWVGPFSTEIRVSIDRQFNEKSNTVNTIKKTIKKLIESGDDRFDYSEKILNKNVTIDAIRRIAKKSNTPYIVYDRVYDDELGIVSI